MGGLFSRGNKQPAGGPAEAPVPSGTITIDGGLASALAEQRSRRAVGESRSAFEKECEARSNAASADAILAAKAGWEAEKRSLLEAREAELKALEASTAADVERQVVALHAKFDFVRPAAAPRCGEQEASVVACYKAAAAGGDVLDCRGAVDAYSACARAVAADLAASVAAAKEG